MKESLPSAKSRAGLITPEELPIWVPGDILTDSGGLRWKGIGQRTYRYRGLDVEIPPMDHYMIVHYLEGITPMDRQVGGRWSRAECQPGIFSLLSLATDSHWHWTQPLEVSHVYLSAKILAKVAGDMQDKDVAEVTLHDVLHGSDPIITAISAEVLREVQRGGGGSPLYAEALSIQLAVHLLRNYATCEFRQRGPRQLTPGQRRLLDDYIDANLADELTIEGMAAVLNVGVWTLNRLLRSTFGCSAHGLVTARKIERARAMVSAGTLSLKEIAAGAGFSDQAHMTRLFRSYIGTTPGRMREEAVHRMVQRSVKSVQDRREVQP
jgi:AraC family transcriptional regulator